MNKKIMSPYKKVMIIFNPCSGRGKGKMKFFRKLLHIPYGDFYMDTKDNKVFARIIDFFNQYDLEYVLKATEYSGHAIDLAKEAVNDSYDLVVAVGGDGTIHEVANGLKGSPVVMGVIPFGTANVFSCELELPDSIDAICKGIMAGNKRQIDMGQVKDRYFLVMAGVGFDARVTQFVKPKMKSLIGFFSYIMSGVCMLFQWHRDSIVFRLNDDKKTLNASFLIVTNVRFYGGPFIISPHSNLTDGVFEVVCCLKRGRRGLILFFLATLFNFNWSTIVKRYSVKKIQLFSQQPVHLDAEYFGESPFTINLIEKILWIAH